MKRDQTVYVNGSNSTLGNVTSGVSHGSFLGPASFLSNLCDIKEKMQSNMRPYADETIVYREINFITDHNILQENLDTLHEWSNTYLMESIFVNVIFCNIYVNICKCPSEYKEV